MIINRACWQVHFSRCFTFCGNFASFESGAANIPPENRFPAALDFAGKSIRCVQGNQATDPFLRAGFQLWKHFTKPVLSDSATPSNLNAGNFLTVKDNVESYFWNAQLEGDPKHIWHARLSSMVKKLDTIKIYEIAECGKTAQNRIWKQRHYFHRFVPRGSLKK